MIDRGHWLLEFGAGENASAVDGLVSVGSYVRTGRPPEEVAVMEKAQYYQADAVFSKRGAMGSHRSRKHSFIV